MNHMEENQKMKTNQPRNRENRTKPGIMQEKVPLRMMIPRAAFNRIRELERTHQATKEEILLAGLRNIGL